MATTSFFIFLIFLLKLLPLQILAEPSCPESFNCQNFSSLEFPLSNNQPDCGLFMLDCTAVPPLIRLEAGGKWYKVLERISDNKFKIRDPILERFLLNNQCLSFVNLSLPQTPLTSFSFSPNLTMFPCVKGPSDETMQSQFFSKDCSDYTVFYRDPANTSAVNRSSLPDSCWELQLPRNSSQKNPSDLYQLLSPDFDLEWNISADCMNCHKAGGQCGTNSMNEFLCRTPEWNISADCKNCHQAGGQCGTNSMNEFLCRTTPGSKSRTSLIKASAISAAIVLLLSIVVFSVVISMQRRKTIKKFHHLSKSMSSDPSSSKSDTYDGSFHCSIPIFSHNELEEATKNFNPSKELGDGGFGTVYHGILKDGREVAIKRLYENNFKRVEQFINEIKILTGLKHQNLVTLYGCSSAQSRELLLVYEYIQNGTVADHLHKKRGKETLLAWPVRMNIAIEAASALAYLHKSDIVHRDVKTNNILLDSNFTVKVADFGLSRLFPTDVTHISTAPQGTPGYVDPDYHRCYQLTDKSDVYSFGVVLIELISSMPAVDMTRHRDEINLANFALNRIQKCAFDELIDSSLGYNIDAEITRMTTSVAELAFQCLQMDREMRPSMDEVLVSLTEIKKGGAEKIHLSPETDDVEFLKNKNLQSSPSAVTDVWMSCCTTASSID